MSEEKHQELVKLMRENLSYSRKILKSVEKTQRYVLWLKVLNIIKVALIAIPLILAILFLPPYFREITGTYGELFDAINKYRSGEIEDVDPGVIKRILP
jgi:hypothetical protein